MSSLALVKLNALMERTAGRPEVKIGLIDGPVATQHADLAVERIRAVRGSIPGACTRTESAACLHGTFVAGILSAKRGSIAPAICPDCTLLVRPIFDTTDVTNIRAPSSTLKELAFAIVDCIDAGAQVLNVSAAATQLTYRREDTSELEQALELAAKRGVIVIAAAGNRGTLSNAAISCHAWVIPAVSYNLEGKPMDNSNLGISIGRWGLGAPGDRITSIGANGQPLTLGGTSAAAPFVTGTAALLWSEFPAATASEVRLAITQAYGPRRRTVVPPLLDAWAAYQTMRS